MIIYLKRLKSSKFVRVKAFPMYGGIGVSAPSLHRESTDSLIPSSQVDRPSMPWVQSYGYYTIASVTVVVGVTTCRLLTDRLTELITEPYCVHAHGIHGMHVYT